MLCKNPRDLISAIRASDIPAESHPLFMAVIHSETRELAHLATVDRERETDLASLPAQFDPASHHVVFAHEHPAGRAEPNPHDMAMTVSLLGLCQTLGYGFVDHIIFTSESQDNEGNGSEPCFSFAATMLFPLLMLSAGLKREEVDEPEADKVPARKLSAVQLESIRQAQRRLQGGGK